MLEIKRVLCPVDFSDASQHAIEHAIVVSKWYGATVVGLHVHHPIYVPTAPLEPPGFPSAAVADAELVAQLARDLERALAPARAAGLAVEAALEHGVPATRIVEAVHAQRADLVVIGTHGASGFERLALGSVTEKVVRKAACPVLTVPPRAHATSRLPFKRLLCPIDFSQASKSALDVALTLAQEAQADLVLLHVLEWPVDREPASMPGFNVPEYRVFRETEAAAELEALVPAAARDWCTIESRLTHGKPYEQILAVAGAREADLIVIGVHGRNAVDVMLFGSTTNQVIRGATCPVLTLRR
jgi:nucleotide-binding universal stress UspA family protein